MLHNRLPYKHDSNTNLSSYTFCRLCKAGFSPQGLSGLRSKCGQGLQFSGTLGSFFLAGLFFLTGCWQNSFLCSFRAAIHSFLQTLNQNPEGSSSRLPLTVYNTCVCFLSGQLKRLSDFFFDQLEITLL